MAQPWLDGLSDDWEQSDRDLSSPSIPRSSPEVSRISHGSTTSQSRIPRASVSSRMSSSGNFLRPRSTKGLAKAGVTPALAERSPSELNVPLQPTNGNTKTNARASTLPRRASGAFSDSVSSVQHHTVNKASGRGVQKGDTPEWKRRLVRGDKSDAGLFGPTALEGVFHQPLQNANSSLLSSSVLEEKPWTMPADNGGSFNFSRSQSMRRSMTRTMEVLQEETEDESIRHDESLPTSADLGDSDRKDSIIRLEAHHDVMPHQASQRLEDSRMRTVSGREELRNEGISPITISKNNTVNGRSLRGIVSDSIDELRSKLEKLATDTTERPSSSASDKNIQYGYDEKDAHIEARQDLGDITSQSLPDDLSMGTDDFASRGGYINLKRGGHSNENSFLRRNISSSIVQSQQMSQFRSSPPPYNPPHTESGSELPEELPHTPSRRNPGPQEVSSTPDRPGSSGSPLKLFGNHDTYTKARLLRRMSQFAGSQVSSEEGSGNMEEHRELSIDRRVSDADTAKKRERQMSQFGHGELNDYAFTKHATPDANVSSAGSTPSVQGSIFKQTIHYESASLPRVRKSNRPRTPEVIEEATLTIEYTESKRGLISPGKERTPKRRRTLLKDELEAQQMPPLAEDNVQKDVDKHQVAGRKRKDAHYEAQGSPADPGVLATRQMLRPKSASRQSSSQAATSATGESAMLQTTDASITEAIEQRPADTLTKSVAHELASFRESFNQLPARSETRVRSITTSDYFAEATKVMNLIRSKQFGRSTLGKVEQESSEAEEEDEELMHSLGKEDFESTMEQFSRPPSREGVREKQKSKEPDPRVLSHLRKFKDESDPVDLNGGDQFYQDLPTSDPPNVRILNPMDTQRKRKHSDTTASAHPHSQDGNVPTSSSSHGNSTGRSIPTAFSGSSREKGFITSEKINLPTEVGGMIFDEVTKAWVKNRMANGEKSHSRNHTSEEDPFQDIPDLSVDELDELKRSLESPKRSNEAANQLRTQQPISDSRPQTRNGATIPAIDSSSAPSKWTRLDSTALIVETRATSWATAQIPDDAKISNANTEEFSKQSDADKEEEVEHEIQANEGRLPKSPKRPESSDKQPRVVTIAFSSPLVSGIAYQDESSISEHSLAPGNSSAPRMMQEQDLPPRKASRRISTSYAPRRNSIDAIGFVARPVSRIDEYDEHDDDFVDNEKSIIHVPENGSMTPIPARSHSTMIVPATAGKDSSLICLTPLSDFTFHQIDDPVHLELSYVAQRTHPTSLQQAHGQLTLAVDEMVKAITDLEPYEPYWDQIRRLDLSGKELTTLHRFHVYCSNIEELSVADNEINQVADLPATLRTLNIQRNCLSDLSAWGHLYNLQYLDVSGNQIENLDGFSSLVHLRDLRANNNQIRTIDGILDLDGLLSLRLKGNQLSSLDFEACELTRLTHLDLSCNKLTNVVNLHYLPALTYLDLSSNDLARFEPSRPLLKLTTLKLSSNNLSSLKLDLFPSLQTLYLDNNSFHTIDGLSTARHLEILSVRAQKSSSAVAPQSNSSSNIVTTILSTPSDVRKLYLSMNALPQSHHGTLPPITYPLLSLQYLDLASCGISDLPFEFGPHLPNLRVLNLNFNAIKDLNPLIGIVRLNKLLVVGNRIQRLRKSVRVLEMIGGRNGSSLTKVDFRGNQVVAGFYWVGDLWRGQKRSCDSNDRKSSKTSNADVNIGLDYFDPIFERTLQCQHDQQHQSRNHDLDKSNDVETKPQSPRIQLSHEDPYILPSQSPTKDLSYFATLDRATRLKRRIWEALLSEKLPGLKEVDGLKFERINFDDDDGETGHNDGQEMSLKQKEKGEVMRVLMGLGVLRETKEKEGEEHMEVQE